MSGVAPESWRSAAHWALLAGGSAGLSALFGIAHVPAALMLGPIVCGALLAMRGSQIRVARPPYLWGQAIAGTLIALNLDPAIVGRTVEIWPVVLAFVLLTLALACAVGLVAARLTGLDREVTVWGFLPGMAGTMIALAHERGIDSRMVAFIQILRLLMVIATMVVVGAALVGPPVPHDAGAPLPDALSTSVAMLLGLLGICVSRFAPIVPAGASLVPLVALVAGSLLTINGINVAPPYLLVAVAYFFLGAQVGLRFTPDMIRTGARAMPWLPVAGALLLVLCAGSGALLSVVAGVDLMSAMLATVPGSVDSIALIALSTGSDISFIMTLQTVRLFAVVLLGPPMARGMLALLRRLRPPEG
ncbi:AbrB family transcriptional regulator [Cereibacter changlensis]|uniref:AbrB family transcriptional regulator n=1 Tax=Cereibacter changlensis TaxID=402884 RepID=A0A4U0YZQ8_9RHOB|nr:AbrB family transcriptional regulator [Cereibacter changlensis]TKA97338.1 AbrB family transcriptional regulator [Cereibacter changlensis]